MGKGMEKRYKLELNRPDCIGCAACTAVAPDHWEMDDDGKAKIKGCKTREDSWQEKDISEEDMPLNKEAAECCPVNVIHVTDKEKDEKLI